MATTSEGIRYPVATDPFQPHVDIQRVAEDVDPYVAAVDDAWTAFTPTITAESGGFAAGNSVITGRYKRIGQTVHAQASFHFGSTVAPGTGFYRISLPPGLPAVGGTVEWLGLGHMYDGSGNSRYIGGCVPVVGDPTKVYLLYSGLGGVAGASTPFVPADTDLHGYAITYETSAA